MRSKVHPGLHPLARLFLVLLLLSPLALAVPQLSGKYASGGPSDIPRTIEATRPVLGYAIVAHHIGDLKLYLRSVDAIADLGANALTVVTPFFQKYVDSSEIRHLPAKCPTPDQLEAILKHARSRGLMTTLQPIVLIEKPGEKDWRGVIEPRDWEKWWVSYNQLIDYFLDVANESKVDLFVIGSELNTTEDQLERWEAITSKVRTNFEGQITYSANWDRYNKSDIWPLVDAVSVSSYFELERNTPGAELEKLIAAWKPIRDRLVNFAQEQELPLLLSEVGYPSLPWANAHPWNYVAEGERADHEMQARCYEAFFAAWGPAFADPSNSATGFFCYHWDPYHHGHSNDTGYGVQGKPALKIIERGFRDILEYTPPTTAPATSQPETQPEILPESMSVSSH